MKEKKLIVLIILLVFSYTSNAQEVWIDSIQYKLIPKGNAAEVINCNIRSEKVIVPSTIYYEGELYNVVTIASRAFRNTRYKSVQLPESITYIGTDAFYGCTFESITIPDNVTTIGPSAFQECKKLTSISFGKNVQTIHYNAFQDCESLSSVVFPEKLKIIFSLAFKGCKSLKVVTIGKGLEQIGTDAFSTTSIEKVHISDIALWCNIIFDHVTSNPLWCGADLYLNDELIEELIIPSNVETIKKRAFYGCKSLKSITIQNGVKSIESAAFSGCESLSEVFLPNSITTIKGLFGGCNNIKNIIIPEGVKEVNDFSNNPNLTSVILPNSLLRIGGFQKCTGLTSIILPTNLENINDYAFSGCTNLLSLSIPSKVSEVGLYAFQGCTSLETLTIESGVGKIGYYAFSNCEKLINVDLDAEWYSNMAFDNCNEIKTVYLGSNTKRIEGIFKDCEKIEDVYCYATEVPHGGDSFTYSYIQYITLHVPETSIEKYKQASYPWNQFKEIVAIDGIPVNTETEMNGIKYKAISYTEVEVVHKDDYSGDIVIPETVSINDKEYKVTSIGKDAFYYTQISAITIPEGITKIEDRAFMGCSMLKTIELANSIIEIGENAFCSCSELESVKLPHNLRKIGPGSFYYCGKLKKIVIPEMIERICAFTFRSCHDLETVIIPNKVTSIGDAAFADCWNLKTVVLGEKINTIGKAAFENCWYIEKIYTLDRTPPILNVDDNDYHTKMLDDIKTTFQNGWYLFGELYTYKTATLWVPESSLDEYKNHIDWGQFVNIQAFDPNTFNPSTLGIKTITNYEEEMNRYSIDGRKLSMPTKGVNIIRMKNGTVKKVLMK